MYLWKYLFNFKLITLKNLQSRYLNERFLSEVNHNNTYK